MPCFCGTLFKIFFKIVNNAQWWFNDDKIYLIYIFQLICVKKMVCKWFIFISILIYLLHVYFFPTFYHISLLHISVTLWNVYFLYYVSRGHCILTVSAECRICAYWKICNDKILYFRRILIFNEGTLLWAFT